MTLTARQSEVVVHLRNYRRKHGYSPTLVELAKAMGCCKVVVFEMVDTLVNKGVLKRDRYRARSLAIVNDDAVPAAEHSTQLPLLGTISSGSPINAVEKRECLDLEKLFACSRGVYVLRVRGESLAGEHLHDGDNLIVERREEPRQGELIVATLDGGGVVVRRFYVAGDRVRLVAQNPACEPLIVRSSRLRVAGVVVGMLRTQ